MSVAFKLTSGNEGLNNSTIEMRLTRNATVQIVNKMVEERLQITSVIYILERESPNKWGYENLKGLLRRHSFALCRKIAK